MTCLLRHKAVRCTLAVTALVGLFAAPTLCQEESWLPTLGTHAWARFGKGAWKTVQIRTSVYDENEQVIRSSTTIARTRVNVVASRSVSLCVTATVEVAGQEFASEPQEITRDLAPQVESSKELGDETLTIDGQEHRTKVIELVTISGTKRETSRIYHNETAIPQTLKRVTTTVDTQLPDVTTLTTVDVTELDKKIDILGEKKRSWAVTTVITKPGRTVTIHEVHSQDVPGELVSQVTEERNSEGKLVSRSELELVGCGKGRIRRLFRRAR